MTAGDVKVCAIRPHDTAEGMKQPGDEYSRPAAEAATLEAAGVIAIVAAKKAAKATS